LRCNGNQFEKIHKSMKKIQTENLCYCKGPKQGGEAKKGKREKSQQGTKEVPKEERRKGKTRKVQRGEKTK